MSVRRFAGLAFLAALFVPTLASADSPADAGASADASSGPSLRSTMQCSVRPTQMDKYRYLRAMSLDVRGVVPTPAEYRKLEGSDRRAESFLGAWLSSSAFGRRVVRWHRKLLWNNLENVRFYVNDQILRQEDDTGIYWSPARARWERGDRVPCLDEPAEYDQNNELVMKQKQGGQWKEAPAGACENSRYGSSKPCREGWVRVQPYWAPNKTVKVCALDAREKTHTASGKRCTGANYECGCGENLRDCVTRQTRRVIKDSMAEQVEKLIRSVVLQDRSYLALFRSNETFFNGPLVHFWKYHAGDSPRLDLEPGPYEMERLPDLKYADRTSWEKTTVGVHHAGVLTSPAYLLRFPRNRQRANHFYKKFLCQPFEPPESGLQINTSGEKVEPDLQERSGCQYCHSRLEPAAAHWGRWLEVGAGYMDRRRYPAHDPACESCATSSKRCSERCSERYITDLTARYKQPYAGMLDSFLFRRKRHEVNVRRGPEHLVEQTVGDNRFLECAARTRAQALLGRSLGPEESKWLNGLVETFVESGYSYRKLVKAIVTSPKYRRVR